MQIWVDVEFADNMLFVLMLELANYLLRLGISSVWGSAGFSDVGFGCVREGL